MKIVYNSCPNCMIASRKGIVVINKTSSIEEEVIKCISCGWVGKWDEMKKFVFKK